MCACGGETCPVVTTATAALPTSTTVGIRVPTCVGPKPPWPIGKPESEDQKEQSEPVVADGVSDLFSRGRRENLLPKLELELENYRAQMHQPHMSRMQHVLGTSSMGTFSLVGGFTKQDAADIADAFIDRGVSGARTVVEKHCRGHIKQVSAIINTVLQSLQRPPTVTMDVFPDSPKASLLQGRGGRAQQNLNMLRRSGSPRQEPASPSLRSSLGSSQPSDFFTTSQDY